jgi:hypothetical protein
MKFATRLPYHWCQLLWKFHCSKSDMSRFIPVFVRFWLWIFSHVCLQVLNCFHLNLQNAYIYFNKIYCTPSLLLMPATVKVSLFKKNDIYRFIPVFVRLWTYNFFGMLASRCGTVLISIFKTAPYNSMKFATHLLYNYFQLLWKFYCSENYISRFI